MVSIFGFKSKSRAAKPEQTNFIIDDDKAISQDNIPNSISKCQELVKSIFGNSSDLVIQTFDTRREKALIVYVDGLVNKNLVDRDIIAPLKANDFIGDIPLAIKTHYKVVNDMQTFVGDVLQGNTAVFYENSQKILIIDFMQWDKRAVETPDVEAVTRGPREGFSESIRTNSALLRRIIKTPKFIIENMIIGRQTNTTIAIAYIEGIVNQDVLSELKSRLSKIDTDAILESGYIEQHLDENTFSPVSGIGNTQKPDVAAAKILEGRVAVLCDGTPHVLTVPALFVENAQTAEDYYNRVLLVSILRLIRITGILITLILPGLVIAILTYSPEMIPSVFMTNLISSTARTPLPTAAEYFFLILMFELLREAGTRLPKTVGSAITIVGALILGNAAVDASIVGAPAVIIIAITAVTGFIAPNITGFMLVYRLMFLLLGSTLGLIGIGSGLVIMTTQLVSTTSFGIPILSSYSSNEFKDNAIRFPLQALKYRPASIAKENVKRSK